jgi:RNA polymerase sigma-70 factor (ECF subfamily)
VNSEPPTEASRSPRGYFATTHWTQVLEARGESPAAKGALSELCAAYYAPVAAFIRYAGRDEEAARDLSQEFFAGLLAGHGLDSLEPGRGRFRSFLLGAVKHFLADQHDRAQAAKRGGGQTLVSIEAGSGTNTTAELQIPDPAGPTTDMVFDRQWALTLVERAVNLLAGEFAAAGKPEQFETLKPWLLGEVDSLSQAAAASRLGMTEGAAKVAIHRLRKRFREVVKGEIARTVSDATHVQEELQYLVEVLSAS